MILPEEILSEKHQQRVWGFVEVILDEPSGQKLPAKSLAAMKSLVPEEMMELSQLFDEILSE